MQATWRPSATQERLHQLLSSPWIRFFPFFPSHASQDALEVMTSVSQSVSQSVMVAVSYSGEAAPAPLLALEKVFYLSPPHIYILSLAQERRGGGHLRPDRLSGRLVPARLIIRFLDAIASLAFKLSVSN